MSEKLPGACFFAAGNPQRRRLFPRNFQRRRACVRSRFAHCDRSCGVAM